MNKATQTAVEKALRYTTLEPAFAAVSLATLYNAATTKARAELLSIITNNDLKKHLTEINGCLVRRTN